jgi:glucose-6-phosphate 1-epimerase
LEPSESVKAKFSAPFKLTYAVTLAGHQLTCHLHAHNPSETDTFTFQALLHTYIRANVALTTITPLKGLTYINKLKPGLPEEVEEREAIDVREPADFVYKSAPGHYEVSWGGELGVEIHAVGFKDVVIWNPGQDGKKMSDLEDGGWYYFFIGEEIELFADNYFSGIILSVLNPALHHIGSTCHPEKIGTVNKC